MFDEYIYAAIIEAAAQSDGFTPESYLEKGAGSSLLAIRQLQGPAFLASCCLVNKEWCKIGRRLLYRTVVTGDASSRSSGIAKTVSLPHIAPLVRYLCLKTDDASAQGHLSKLGTLPNLESLVVHEGRVEELPRASLSYHTSDKLIHLLYEGGDTYQLGRLMACLPHLKSLHVGRFRYSSTRRSAPAQIPVVCRLQEVTLQSVYHYDVNLFEWMFASSRRSIEHVTIAHFGSLLNDMIPYFGRAKRLDLTVKNNVFGVPEDPEHYQLSAIIPYFTNLEELHLHSGQDWRTAWPDAKHASLQDDFPHIRIHYDPYKHNFLESTARVA